MAEALSTSWRARIYGALEDTTRMEAEADRMEQAAKQLESVLATHPFDPMAISAMGEVEAGSGHASRPGWAGG